MHFKLLQCFSSPHQVSSVITAAINLSTRKVFFSITRTVSEEGHENIAFLLPCFNGFLCPVLYASGWLIEKRDLLACKLCR